jgi:hypothetical protein
VAANKIRCQKMIGTDEYFADAIWEGDRFFNGFIINDDRF